MYMYVSMYVYRCMHVIFKDTTYLLSDYIKCTDQSYNVLQHFFNLFSYVSGSLCRLLRKDGF